MTQCSSPLATRRGAVRRPQASGRSFLSRALTVNSTALHRGIVWTSSTDVRGALLTGTMLLGNKYQACWAMYYVLSMPTLGTCRVTYTNSLTII